jgi:hypothetical protein
LSILEQKFKADAGKVSPFLLLKGMPRALLLVSAVLSYGAQKYEAHSWKRVAGERYENAKLRHLLDNLAELGENDEESGLLHLAHEACNTLFLLQQKVEGLTPEEFKSLLKFKKPPTGHKK